MDSQLVSEVEQSSIEDDEKEGRSQEERSTLFQYSNIFHEHFPYYINYGMTYDQFWNDDPCLVKDYRKAAEIAKERKNDMLWLQGMYVYEALCRASALFRSFAKGTVKAMPYLEKPYDVTLKQKVEHDEKEAKDNYEQGFATVMAWANAMHKKFATNEEVNDDGRDRQTNNND